MSTPRTYTMAEKTVSDALMATWRAADEREDWEVGEQVKTALDALSLPWVSLREEMTPRVL